MAMTIPFNKPFLTGKEAHYIYQAVYSGKLSGNGVYTKKCQNFFEEQYGFKKALMTTSCTDALEMAAILCDIKPGDEVIAPSYTFVSTVLAFVRQGAKIVFCDSCKHNPDIDPDRIEALITPRTRVIIPVHYAGVACDMDRIMDIAHRHNLLVVEDAAQAIGSYYKGRPLGSIGHFGCFSFHETKNIIAGEGGSAHNQRREVHTPFGNHMGERHQPFGILPRRSQQIRLDRHRLVVPPLRAHFGIPLGADREHRHHPGTSQSHMGNNIMPDSSPLPTRS